MKRWVLSVLIIIFCILFTCCGAVDTEEPSSEDITDLPVEVPVETTVSDTADEPEPLPLSHNALNPLTGLYDMSSDNTGKCPFAVMLINYRYTRWQSGIGDADIIIEAVSEQGQTQIICMYADIRNVGVIGPVGHLYSIPLNAAYGLNPIVVHNGYPKDCPDDYAKQKEIQTLDGEVLDSLLFVDEERNKDYLLEYSLYTDGKSINNSIYNMGGDNENKFETTAFSFSDTEETGMLSDFRSADKITAIFSGAYDIDLRYNEATGKYSKYQFLFAHSDHASKNKPLEFENAFILFARYIYLEDLNGVRNRLVDADYSSGGKGYYFTKGCYREIIWEKKTDEFFSLMDSDGQILEVNPGKTYIAVVNAINDFTLSITEQETAAG